MNYNDIFWNKIWSDHLKAQAYDTLINSSVVHETENAEESEKEKEDEEIPMIGDFVEGEKKNGK